MASANHPNQPPRPIGIVFLSLLSIISGIQLLGSSLWCFVVSANADKPEIRDALSRVSPGLADGAAGVFFMVALVFLVLSMSSFLLARGYYLGRERARARGRMVSTFAIVWALLGILLLPARLDPASPWWTILFNAVIVLYLGRESIRAYFRH